MKDELYQALQDCIQLNKQGLDPVECLARYPQHAYELEPLLLAAVDSAPALGFRMTREAKTQTRLRVMAEWDRRHAPHQRWSLASLMPKLGFAPRWAMATAVLVLALTLGGAGTVAAAQESVPGNSLYPVKELREEARLWFARSAEEKATIYTSLVQERAQELQELAFQGASNNASVAIARLEDHISEAHQLTPKVSLSPGNDAPPVETSISHTLGQAMVELDGTADLLETTLEESGPSLFPCLSHTYKTIQQARAKVSRALEGIGPTASTLTIQGRGTNGNLCPP
ncbi:MAG: DUF5667 domain-containing protein [Dehalococcoidia bacterium]